MPRKVAGSKSKKRYKVKFYSTTVQSRLLPILKMLDAGNYPAKVARFLGMSKQHVSYYIAKMRKAGLIKRRNIKWPAFYIVTAEGQKFLGRCKGLAPGFLFRLHRCGFKYPVLSGPKEPLDWRRVPQACGHWTALIGDEGGVKVVKTTRHVIVWCESISGRDPDELLLRAKGWLIVWLLVLWLSMVFGWVRAGLFLRSILVFMIHVLSCLVGVLRLVMMLVRLIVAKGWVRLTGLVRRQLKIIC